MPEKLMKRLLAVEQEVLAAEDEDEQHEVAGEHVAQSRSARVSGRMMK